MTSPSRARIRRPSTGAKRPQLLIFTEGEQTEPVYLTHWYRLYRERVIVRIAPHRGTTPLALVHAAIDQRTRDRSEAKRGRGDAFDEYWCVFDVDAHPNLNDALDLAAAREINVALSNPCIELWFAIHLQNQTAYLERHEAQRTSHQLLGFEKTPTLEALQRLVDTYDVAKARAQALDRKHRGDGSPPHSNPSADVWRIIDTIRGGARSPCEEPRK